MAREWSTYQTAIFEAVARGSGHLVVIARAGCGKTTVLIESTRHVKPGQKVLMCAFNKSIQLELADRAPDHADVRTLHSLGLLAVKKAWGKIRIDDKRTEGFVKRILPREAAYENHIAVRKLVGLAKNLWLHTAEELVQAAIEYDLSTSEYSQELLAEYALEVLSLSKDPGDGAVDFDDMIWLPCELGMNVPSWDVVFVDEAQDLNKCQLHLAEAAAGPGRIIVCGDPAQAIYGFRGADSDAIPRMTKKLSAQVLPLSITYRCPREVVKLARQIVPDFEAWEQAPDGEVTSESMQRLLDRVQPGDFVLSRTNAPLMGICLALIKAGKRARIQGRDTGKVLLNLIARSEREDVEGLVEWLVSYRDLELKKLIKAKASEGAIEALYDKIDTLIALTDGCRTVAEVRERLFKLFDDSGPEMVICSTVHKAKGLETDQVWMLATTFRPERSVEESNIYYVAVTRAKRALRLVY